MMKLRAFLLAAVGVVGMTKVAVAQAPAPPAQPGAQPPAAPAQPGAPVAPAQPAQPGAPAAPGTAAAPPSPPDAAPVIPVPPPTPAAPEAAAPPASPTPPAAAPPPPVQVQWNTSTGADTTSDQSKAKPLFWRGTTLGWNQSATTTIFGIGANGDDPPEGQKIPQDFTNESYGWDFMLKPNIYLVDRPKDSVTLSAQFRLITELTNSDTTVDRNEWQLFDTLVAAKYNRSLWESSGKDAGEYKTSAALTMPVVLPTSPASSCNGTYFRIGLTPSISQQIKLLGTKADGLNNVTVGLGVGYSHLFTRGTAPEGCGVSRPRQGPSGLTVDSEVLTGRSFDVDRLTPTLTVDLPLYKDLSLSVASRYWINYKADFRDDEASQCVNLPTGCAPIGGNEDPATTTVLTFFNVGLNYPIYEVVDLTLGYANELVPQNGEDGKHRNFFYSPDAQFYFDITANLDVIYSKVTRRDQPKSAAARPKKVGF